MRVRVRVRARVTGHRLRGERERDLVLALPPGPVTARRIVEAAVRAEVAAYQAPAEEASLFRPSSAHHTVGALRMGLAEP